MFSTETTMLTVAAVLFAANLDATESQASTVQLAACTTSNVPDAAKENPELAAILNSWSSEKKITVTEAAADRLVSEYLCVESNLQRRLPSTPPAELREVGLEVQRTYLDFILTGKEGNLATAFAFRLGLGGLLQPEPRKYRNLKVVTTPDAASAALDGTGLPSKACLATVGSHTLTAEQQGFLACKRQIQVDPGNTEITERCDLKPKP